MHSTTQSNEEKHPQYEWKKPSDSATPINDPIEFAASRTTNQPQQRSIQMHGQMSQAQRQMPAETEPHMRPMMPSDEQHPRKVGGRRDSTLNAYGSAEIAAAVTSAPPSSQFAVRPSTQPNSSSANVHTGHFTAAPQRPATPSASTVNVVPSTNSVAPVPSLVPMGVSGRLRHQRPSWADFIVPPIEAESQQQGQGQEQQQDPRLTLTHEPVPERIYQQNPKYESEKECDYQHDEWIQEEEERKKELEKENVEGEPSVRQSVSTQRSQTGVNKGEKQVASNKKKKSVQNKSSSNREAQLRSELTQLRERYDANQRQWKEETKQLQKQLKQEQASNVQLRQQLSSPPSDPRYQALHEQQVLVDHIEALTSQLSRARELVQTFLKRQEVHAARDIREKELLKLLEELEPQLKQPMMPTPIGLLGESATERDDNESSAQHHSSSTAAPPMPIPAFASSLVSPLSHLPASAVSGEIARLRLALTRARSDAATARNLTAKTTQHMDELQTRFQSLNKESNLRRLRMQAQLLGAVRRIKILTEAKDGLERRVRSKEQYIEQLEKKMIAAVKRLVRAKEVIQQLRSRHRHGEPEQRRGLAKGIGWDREQEQMEEDQEEVKERAQYRTHSAPANADARLGENDNIDGIHEASTSSRTHLSHDPSITSIPPLHSASYHPSASRTSDVDVALSSSDLDLSPYVPADALDPRLARRPDAGPVGHGTTARTGNDSATEKDDAAADSFITILESELEEMQRELDRGRQEKKSDDKDAVNTREGADGISSAPTTSHFLPQHERAHGPAPLHQINVHIGPTIAAHPMQTRDHGHIPGQNPSAPLHAAISAEQKHQYPQLVGTHQTSDSVPASHSDVSDAATFSSSSVTASASSSLFNATTLSTSVSVTETEMDVTSSVEDAVDDDAHDDGDDHHARLDESRPGIYHSQQHDHDHDYDHSHDGQQPEQSDDDDDDEDGDDEQRTGSYGAPFHHSVAAFGLSLREQLAQLSSQLQQAERSARNKDT